MTCLNCKNSGWIAATHKTKATVYAFRCSCSSSNRYTTAIPVWTKAHEKDFEPDFMEAEYKEPRPRIQSAPIKGPKIDYQARASNDVKDFDDDCPF